MELAKASCNVDFSDFAEALLDTTHEVMAEGGIPERDPAVIFIGAIVAFHVHADVALGSTYHNLIEQCQARINDETRIIQ